MVKPDGISRGLLPEILKHIKNSGLSIQKRRSLIATEKYCRKHYGIKEKNKGVSEKQMLEFLKLSYLKGKKVQVLIVCGKDVINKAYSLKMRVRKYFCNDTLRKCRAEKRALRTILHSSETKKEARKEIRAWLN